MEAFTENINALEQKLKVFIQKWKDTSNENEILIKRNEQLTEQINRLESGVTQNLEAEKPGQSEAFDPSYIINAIDQYIEKIETCIDKINIELDG